MSLVTPDAFDFLGYTFGPVYSPRTGGRYNGVRPSTKAVASIRDAIRQRLRPGQAPWEDIVRTVNRTVRGWCNCFSYGTEGLVPEDRAERRSSA